MSPTRVRSSKQSDLFGAAVPLPDGFSYGEDILSVREEKNFVRHFADLPFEPFEFHGYLGKRRIVSFGWRYDYAGRALRESAVIPDFLLPLREKAASFAHLPSESLQQILVTEYAPGAGIGWHRDKPMFAEVVAISFLSACTLRFRRKSKLAWERRSIIVQPRSAYLLSGPARQDWQHSVPPVAELRYSVTFRNFIAGKNGV